MGQDTTLFDDVGGRSTLEKVHKIFYDKIYKHPWIGQYFVKIDQAIIERQQTDFMTGAMGGPEIYSGRFPADAHKHMYVTDELFDLRKKLLTESLIEAEIPKSFHAAWLKIDSAFRAGIVKSNISECEKRFTTDEVLAFENPVKKAA